MAAAAHRAAGVLTRPRALALLAPLVVLLALRAFVAEPFSIPSASMTPTLAPGEHVLADKLAYRLHPPRRGDLVVFRRAGAGEVLLKRVVAVGGQRVAIEDGVLVVDGRRPAEPYVEDARLLDSQYFGPVTVPRGSVFVLGDRRSDSIDSRRFGPVQVEDVIGRVDARIWPPSRWGGL